MWWCRKPVKAKYELIRIGSEMQGYEYAIKWGNKYFDFKSPAPIGAEDLKVVDEIYESKIRWWSIQSGYFGDCWTSDAKTALRWLARFEAAQEAL